MPRPPRRDIVAPDSIFHVYARGNDRMTLFKRPEDYRSYLADIAELKTPHGVLLYHYVLMPNHIHLVLRILEAGLSDFMQSLQNRFAKRFCRDNGFAGHVWQGRFKSKPIDNDGYLLACGNYVEMNPVRSGLVGDPEQWPHSSCRFYTHGRPDKLVDMDPLYPTLARTAAQRQKAYRQFIRHSVPVSGT